MQTGSKPGCYKYANLSPSRCDVSFEVSLVNNYLLLVPQEGDTSLVSGTFPYPCNSPKNVLSVTKVSAKPSILRSNEKTAPFANTKVYNTRARVASLAGNEEIYRGLK